MPKLFDYAETEALGRSIELIIPPGCVRSLASRITGPKSGPRAHIPSGGR